MASGAVQCCGIPPGGDDICARIRRKINELISRNKREHGGLGTHGLEHRFRELLSNLGRGETSSYEGHVTAIRNQQVGLERELDNFRRNGCGDPPPGAWSWRLREVPKPAPQGIDPNTMKRAAIVGGGLGAGYLIYRAIRLLPSLFPPLWPTIPGNLAIP